MKKQNKPGDMFNKFQYKKKKWIQSAITKKGALHKELGVPMGKKIPAGKLNAAAKKGGKEGKRAQLAKTLASFHKKKMAKKGKKTMKKRSGPVYPNMQNNINSMKSGVMKVGKGIGNFVKKEVGALKSATTKTLLSIPKGKAREEMLRVKAQSKQKKAKKKC